ncbi:cyclin CCL1 [Arthroderma uncinatum]|uniref:cyclin CCL1 n=1 Tax=Arthroderma uncinatum TaxID=74035 RepID=UPI00144AF300|nr:cyclin CCL1 [Arthroderma uncinatum]KAF3482479.1 cyclin CCL1 [Arthroderma uncinatum]
MLEDDIYRTSTQYRLWSFTEDSLRTIRANTNALASERVRAAVRRLREARQQSTATPTPEQGTPNPNPSDGERAATPAQTATGGEQEVECLTPDEEFELVQYYCEKTMELGDEYKPPLPTTVRATAIQYLRRFYLTNSPMTYHPKSIMPCALFLATKTDNFYMSLRSFTEHIPKMSMEDIIAPEFLLTQGLRFTFDVRHPFRGLEGGMMELNAIAKGEATPGPHHPGLTVPGLQKAIQSLAPPPPSIAGPVPATPLSTRLAKVHHNTREILKHSAQMTDVYFLYTPSQIWLSALLIADKPLAEFYLETKLGPPAPSSTPASTSPSAMLSALHAKLIPILQSCCALLAPYIQNNGSSGTAPGPRLRQIGRKLYHCQNPERKDLTALNKLQKQGGSAIQTGTNTPSESAAAPAIPSIGGGGGDEQGLENDIDRAAKKRKLEREKFQGEKDSLFGGELRK